MTNSASSNQPDKYKLATFFLSFWEAELEFE